MEEWGQRISIQLMAEELEKSALAGGSFIELIGAIAIAIAVALSEPEFNQTYMELFL